MYWHTCTRTLTHTHLHILTHMHTDTHTHTHTHIYWYTYRHTCTRTLTCTCTLKHFTCELIHTILNRRFNMFFILGLQNLFQLFDVSGILLGRSWRWQRCLSHRRRRRRNPNAYSGKMYTSWTVSRLASFSCAWRSKEIWEENLVSTVHTCMSSSLYSPYQDT